jgi:hypothetical protein
LAAVATLSKIFSGGFVGRVKLPAQYGFMRTTVMVVLWAAVCAAGGIPRAQAQQWHPMVFREDAPGVDENPLRGFMPYSNTRQTPESFPHSLEWFYLPLSDVVTGPDLYDWTAVESQLTAIAGRGHQAVFQFYLDYPKKPSGIPKYLLDAGLQTFFYTDAYNASSRTPSVAPDYRDRRLIECMLRFIGAFGEKYDGDLRIAYLTAGLYGFWGEWHVHNHPLPGEPSGWKISQKDKDALLRAYVASFRRTAVMVRYPKVTHDRRLLAHFGFHDASFLWDTLGPEDWKFWPMLKRYRVTGAWQAHPIGGEIYPQLQAEIWDRWPNSEGQDVRAAIARTHVTWMLDSGLFTPEPTAPERANALRAERMLGYTLFCAASRTEQGKDGSLQVTVRLENRGVAPVYYAWPVDLEALDGGGNVVGQTRLAWPLPALLPGNRADWSGVIAAPVEGVSAVLLRIRNPMPGGHDLAFANAEMGTVKAGWLTLASGGLR